MPKFNADKEYAMVGRANLNVEESLLWSQRIGKEDKVNAIPNHNFSIRNAVSVEDVPMKFKVGHIDPMKEIREEKKWHPADNGWSTTGAEAKEFRRCMNAQVGGPRNFESFPVTTYQDIGWLMSQAGAPIDRVKKVNNRMGIGWMDLPKKPSEFSQSTANPPPMLGRSSSQPGSSSVLTNSPPVEQPSSQLAPAVASSSVSRTSPSCVRDTCPWPQVPTPSRTPASSVLSHAHSTPSIMMHPVDRLQRREEKVADAMQEAKRYYNHGERGIKHSRFLGTTDATQFQSEFTKASSGVPMHKQGGRGAGQGEIKLKDKHGMPVSKWR